MEETKLNNDTQHIESDLYFSVQIKNLRRSLGLSQKDFSGKIGITPATLSAYEVGDKGPTLATAEKIARAFNVSLDWLCGLSKEKMRNEKPTKEDIAKALVMIFENTELYFSEEGCRTSFDSLHMGVQTSIVITETVFQEFIQGYEKMVKLVADNTISAQLFGLWLKDQLETIKDSDCVKR